MYLYIIHPYSVLSTKPKLSTNNRPLQHWKQLQKYALLSSGSGRVE
jgi:hypothetical protein